ncbi:copper resistance protein CopC/CopD (plasmid) [Streptomyces sp. NBC_00335]|uniref:copper resistance CopC/CopD family protein n=1 Tax=unclassified Streptomyces TaxID=2593676 RepID=UPI0022517F31|nr:MULTISPECIES: copper resistance protein CopC [unclassified Streptomyces]MCX5410015.1 copper resistance protein CopC/CopD [Streptomyces sp. NBC_00086]
MTVVAGMALAVPAQPAQAHAQLLSSSPANGERLATAPSEVTLTFSEGASPVEGGMRLDGPRGDVELGGARNDPAAPDKIVVPLPGTLNEGVHTLTWRVVSADSHPIYGVIVFAVGSAELGELPAAGAGTDADPTVRAVFTGLRWLGYAALGLLGGGAVFLLFCWPAGWARTRPRRLLAGAWAAALAAAAGVLLIQGPYAAGRGLGALLEPSLLGSTVETDFGRYVLGRIGLLAVAGPLLLLAVRGGGRTGGAARRALAVTGAVLLPATWLGTGHANAEGELLVSAADLLHTSAMTAWFGGLAFLLLSVVRRKAPLPADQVGTALRRFSWIAGTAVLVLTVTGIYRAWRGVGSVQALTGTSYGTLLVLKLAAVGVLVWGGALSRSVVRRRYAATPAAAVTEKVLAAVGGPSAPAASATGRTTPRAEAERERSARRQLRWSLRVEVAFAVVVLAFTAVLVATPPGSRPAAPVPTAQRVEVKFTGGSARIVLDPARAGADARLTVRISDAKGAVRDVPEVSAALRQASGGPDAMRFALTRQGPGEFSTSNVILPVAGVWKVELKVRTTDIDLQTVESELRVR